MYYFLNWQYIFCCFNHLLCFSFGICLLKLQRSDQNSRRAVGNSTDEDNSEDDNTEESDEEADEESDDEGATTEDDEDKDDSADEDNDVSDSENELDSETSGEDDEDSDEEDEDMDVSSNAEGSEDDISKISKSVIEKRQKTTKAGSLNFQWTVSSSLLHEFFSFIV